MDRRLELLNSWLRESLGLHIAALEPASGDASFRRYFRLTLADGTTRIVMDAPPEQEDCRPFVEIARDWGELGLNIPHIYAEDLEQGFLLLSDLGSSLYLDVLSAEKAGQLYRDAMEALLVIQGRAPTTGLPLYDRTLLLQEMALFKDWLLQEQLGIELDAVDSQMLEQTFEFLATTALQQPQVPVHRDYHSRNLMVTAPPSPGVIDFQDAVVGPVTYDLVSLLRDCYISWPRPQVERWAEEYFLLAQHSGVLRHEHRGEFMRWFDLMGVQRQLKAAGIFARLNIRDGKSGYLADIPRTLGYIVEVAPDYPELTGIAALIQQLPSVVTNFQHKITDKH